MPKQLKIGMIIFILLVVVGFVCIKIVKVQDRILEWMYPRKYQEQVEKYAKQYQQDPLLIFSIIKAESNFNPEVVSSSGAKGLMQLMDSTAIEIAEKIKDPIKPQNLFDPEKNIKIGTKYFSDLMTHYNDNILLSLTAYNAGIGNVDEWVKEGIIREDGTDVENIPYQETNMYVRKIIRDYQIYYQLYQQGK